jgi:ABC-type antimicrobial peptide transport system permease subunit
VNETLARQWWPDGRALGDRVIIGRFQQKDYPEIRDNPREIVGVAGDTKTVNLKDFPRPTVFVPLPQSKDGYIGMTGKLAWIVKVDNTTGIPQQLRQIIGEFDPTQRIQDLRAMDEIVASATANSRFDAWLFGTFAGLALILAAIGVHGLLAFSVAYRRQEIGTRMALGASRANVLWFFLKQGFILTAIGLGLGLPGAFFLTHSLASLLYGIKPNDPLSFFTVSLVLLLVGVAASYIPSFRATRIDPTVTLRYE